MGKHMTPRCSPEGEVDVMSYLLGGDSRKELTFHQVMLEWDMGFHSEKASSQFLTKGKMYLDTSCLRRSLGLKNRKILFFLPFGLSPFKHQLLFDCGWEGLFWTLPIQPPQTPKKASNLPLFFNLPLREKRLGGVKRGCLFRIPLKQGKNRP